MKKGARFLFWHARPTGFSLIELVGILGILTILAVPVSMAVIRHVNIAAGNAEAANLNTLSNALVLQILRSNSIPGEAAWCQAAGNWLAYPPASITNNARRNSRAYLVDPAGWLGANLPTNGYYSQSSVGTIITNSARILLVSSLAGGLPVSTRRLSATEFSDIWNTPPNQVPGTWTTWKGRGDDLLIQRINLRPLFNRIALANRDSNNAAAYVAAGRTNLIPSLAASNAFYISGSAIGLGSTNSGTTVLQARCVLARDCSYVFENGHWREQIGPGPNPLFNRYPGGLSFNEAARIFISLSVPYKDSDPTKSGDQQQVLSAMVDFMIAYQLWAFNPHGRFTTYSIGSGTNYDSIYSYLQDAAAMINATAGTSKTPNDISGLLY